ncbi:phosphatase PAP2 family protein [Oceanobacillus salinisoli]|uniref:phosphatase PAP2 family protein n=1 Tax=Oceanobacillus salinisoli TaxID=2678611 RepID=UPI001E5D4E37|nr:phosphatase PAP2 family protein [Oceanobacillus salinisoli]
MFNRNLVNFLFITVFIMTVIWIIQIVNGYVPYVDQWTRELVEKFDDTFAYHVFLMITNLGSRHFLIPFVSTAAIVLWIIHKHWLPPFIFAGGTLVTYLFNGVIKNIVQRERPSILEEANAVGNSFPSGHAMISMVCYGLLAYFLIKKLKSPKLSIAVQIIFSLLIFLIGISRYIINVHYLTDVGAGFFLGFIFLVGFLYLYEGLRKKIAPSQVGEKSNL